MSTVPTIATIGPSAGRSHGGYVVYLGGTNFRTTPAVPANGELATDWQRTVKVSVAGWDVGAVEVLSATKCRFMMPFYHGDNPHAFAAGPVAVDVVLSNLNDDGTIKPGETVTKTGFFIYTQKDLTKDSHCLAVDRALIEGLVAGVLPNTVRATSREWAYPGTDLLLRGEEDAETPALYVTGPQEQPSDEANREAEREIHRRAKPGDATKFQILRPPRVVDLVYTVTGVTGEKEDMMCRNLGQALVEWANAVHYLDVPIDPASPSEKCKYPVRMSRDGAPNYGRSGELHQFIAKLVVEGVWMQAETPVVASEGGIQEGTDEEWAFGYPDTWIDIERQQEA